ncbi:hypothetical protein EDB87DRAFT_1578902 [Lactarius vividus]|nr:hypothetical protein EDB87DRAFT_1578902 [Lactarius vividus]
MNFGHMLSQIHIPSSTFAIPSDPPTRETPVACIASCIQVPYGKRLVKVGGHRAGTGYLNSKSRRWRWRWRCKEPVSSPNWSEAEDMGRYFCAWDLPANPIVTSATAESEIIKYRILPNFLNMLLQESTFCLPVYKVLLDLTHTDNELHVL